MEVGTKTAVLRFVILILQQFIFPLLVPYFYVISNSSSVIINDVWSIVFQVQLPKILVHFGLVFCGVHRK